MKRLFCVIIILSTMYMTIGCDTKPPESNELITLKVLAWNSQIFNQNYGNFFIATHTNYDIEVISVVENLKPDEEVNKTIQDLILRENPDVLSMSMTDYELLKEQGELTPLTGLIKKDSFNLKDYTPAVLDILRGKQGKLYGLTPTFIGHALYFNKQIFENNGVPFPYDFMTWDDVFSLAQRFPNQINNQTSQFGLDYKASTIPFMMALNIGGSSGLSIFNGSNFTLDTKKWERVFRNVVDCLKTKVCYDRSNNGSKQSLDRAEVEYRSYPFLTGNIAMSIDTSSLYKTLIMNQERYKNLDWGVVSFPVSVDHPNTGNVVTLNNIFSISSRAKQTEDAWEFIQYICSEEYARLIPRIDTFALTARLPINRDDTLDSFYKLDQSTNNIINTIRELPRTVVEKMDELSAIYMSDILTEKMTVSEALELMESELQTTFDSQ